MNIPRMRRFAIYGGGTPAGSLAGSAGITFSGSASLEVTGTVRYTMFFVW